MSISPPLGSGIGTGYDPYEYFFSSRYRQGGRTVYSVDFSVRDIVTFLPKPDPDKPLDATATQRRIYPAHARDFANYVRDDENWVSPSLLLRGPDIFTFQRQLEGVNTGSTQFGLLGIPKDARAEIQIIDGQHRTLGFHLAWERLTVEIAAARASVARAKDTAEPLVEVEAKERLEALIARRDSLAAERVSIQIMVVEQPEAARRIFVDINDNAKGITGSVKSRFDDRKVVSRALNRVLLNNVYVKDAVDLEMDRVTGSSPHLLGAKHVGDMLRAVTVGNGRISKRLEDELDETEIEREFDSFIEVMFESFPPLADFDNGDLTAPELRAQSLIGSNVMLRSFAAAWWELKQEEWTDEEIAEAFQGFADSMDPVTPNPNDTWFASGVFPADEDGSTNPTSRVQDFKTLTNLIVDICEGTVDLVRA